MPNSGDGERRVVTEDQLREDRARWYLTFISIVFGVFIAVWIEPVSTLFADTKQSDQIQQTLKILWSADAGRGALMFLILVCLWWWYGTFLGRVAPAIRFWAYLYDFVSLCTFAVAFRMWTYPSLFPLVIFLAAGLMLLRFWRAKNFTLGRSRARQAVKLAVGVLSLFMAFMTGAFAAAFMSVGASARLQTWPPWVDYGVVGLLVIGIAVTFLAVSITEGFPFKQHRFYKDWMSAPEPSAAGEGK